MATLQELFQQVQAPQQFNPYQNVNAGNYNYNAVSLDGSNKPTFVAPNQDHSYFKGTATNQANTQYNSLMGNLYNNINTKYNQFQQGATSVDSDYTKRVKENDIRFQQQGNSFNDNMIKRGLGTSSIVTTGLADIGLAGEKQTQNINTERSSVLDNMLGNYTNEYNSFLTNKSGTEADRQSTISNLVKSLYDDYYNKGRDQYTDSYSKYQLQQEEIQKQKQRDFEAKQAEAQRQFQLAEAQKDRDLQKSLAAQAKARSASSGSGYSKSGSSGAKKATTASTKKASQVSIATKEFEAAKKAGLGNKWIQQNGKALKSLSSSAYNSVIASNKKAPQVSKHSTNVYTVRKAGQTGGGRATL